MTTKTSPKNGKLYNGLLAHCQKQYCNISEITTAYIMDGKIYTIDYVSTSGVYCLASNTAIAEKSIDFK
jgi:hypothetical protein